MTVQYINIFDNLTLLSSSTQRTPDQHLYSNILFDVLEAQHRYRYAVYQYTTRTQTTRETCQDQKDGATHTTGKDAIVASLGYLHLIVIMAGALADGKELTGGGIGNRRRDSHE
jgi:hypothetical protein